jgi:hypothetical protein
MVILRDSPVTFRVVRPSSPTCCLSVNIRANPWLNYDFWFTAGMARPMAAVPVRRYALILNPAA